MACCRYPMRCRIFHLAISPLMDRISSFPAWDIRSFFHGYTLLDIGCLMGYPLFCFVSFIAILACSTAFQFVISYAMQYGSSFQIYVSRENILATHSFTGHIVQSYGLNNGGSVVLGPTISFVVVTCRHGEDCTSARCTTQFFWLYRVIYSSEKYLLSQKKLINISRQDILHDVIYENA